MDNLKEAYKLHLAGDYKGAENLYKQILEITPNNAEVLNLLGILNYQIKNFNEAADLILKAIKLEDNVYYYECLGSVYLNIKEFEYAKRVFEIAAERNPKNPENHFNLAMSYKGIGEYEKAEKSYLETLKLSPNMKDANFNLANLYANYLNCSEKAVKYFKKVLELDPDDFESKYFISLNYFREKDYEKGGPFFENRLCRKSAIMSQEKTFPNLMKSAKLYKGEWVKDKVIYTYYEAGFGDIIMYSRYLPLLKERCKKLVFKPRSELIPLFEDNPQLGIDYLEYFTPEKEMAFDYHIPMLSIPYALGLKNKEMFVSREGYLKANPQKTNEYKKEYFDNNDFKIGIKWQGNTYYDKERVIDIKSFKSIFELPNTKIYSMQTAEGSEALKQVDEYEIIDISKTFNNFSDTAAAIENTDLIISNDSSLAHLAGAMGKKCFVLLPYIYNWRWHKDLSSCDWYESVEIFRQKTPNDWQEVMNRVKIRVEEIKNER